MADDRLTAALEEIRERQRSASDVSQGWQRLDERRSAQIKSCYEDVPRLLAALDAVLKPHQPGRFVVFGSVCKRHENHPHFSITAAEAAHVQDCQDCTATVYRSCAGCGSQVPVEQCPVRNAIATAMSGEAET